jgi:hypothetical protein
VRDVFDLSASDNWIAPSLPNLLSTLSENETLQQSLLLLTSSLLRDVFDLSSSDNLITSSVPILLPVLSENEMK